MELADPSCPLTGTVALRFARVVAVRERNRRIVIGASRLRQDPGLKLRVIGPQIAGGEDVVVAHVAGAQQFVGPIGGVDLHRPVICGRHFGPGARHAPNGLALEVVPEQEDVALVGRRAGGAGVAVVDPVVRVRSAGRDGSLSLDPDVGGSAVPAGAVVQCAIQLHKAAAVPEQHPQIVAAAQGLPVGHQLGVIEGQQGRIAGRNGGGSGGDRNLLLIAVRSVPPAGRARQRIEVHLEQVIPGRDAGVVPSRGIA